MMIDNKKQAEEMFREIYITTRTKLLSAIKYAVTQVEERVHVASEAEMPFYQARAKLMREFSDKVHTTPLFEKLDTGWNYVFDIGSRGVTLHLRHWEHVAYVEFDPGEFDLDIGDCDANFPIIKVEPRLLSAEEYAERCGVSGDTIRMWIRRGKIRSAVKLGNAWKIPEVTEPITRGYKNAAYEWNTHIRDTPEGFGFLSDPGYIWIGRLRSKKLPFQIVIKDSDGQPMEERHLSSTEREKLEAYLIARPEVIYTGDLTTYQEYKEESK